MARHSDVTGRYVYLTVDDREYRVYYEEAGAGIPLLCQHTAGTDGRQWRHLLEDPEVTARFRVIAHDLPYHGKSLPPSGEAWWQNGYRLTTDFFMTFLLTLSDALLLDRPIYLGCSMGGHLAGDLALHHPERFRAVIGLEAAMQSHGPDAGIDHLFHPRISKEFAAAAMHGLCSPTSPEEGKRETAWVYGQGAPFVFSGDLHYYSIEHDLTETAQNIDTSKVDVFIFSGEYDWSATPTDCRQLADAIPGASFIAMKGLGHFPMCENYPAFREYLLPVLGRIKARADN